MRLLTFVVSGKSLIDAPLDFIEEFRFLPCHASPFSSVYQQFDFFVLKKEKKF